MSLFTETHCSSFLPFHEDTFVRVGRCIDGQSFMALFTFNGEPKKIVIKLKDKTCNKSTNNAEEREATRNMKQQLEDLILDKIVKLTNFETDENETSLLVEVYLGDICINDEMTRSTTPTDTMIEERPANKRSRIIIWIGNRLRL